MTVHGSVHAPSTLCTCGHPLVNHWQTGKRLCMACPDGDCPDFRPCCEACTVRSRACTTVHADHAIL